MTTPRTNRMARWALSLALFFAGCAITFIVCRGLIREAADSGLERRKEVIADDRQRIRIPGIGVVEYQRLFEAVSEPGETMDEFAARIGPRLREFSDQTGFEACGVIATDGQRFGVVIGSNRSHVACANFTSKVPVGMQATEETIHSHGRNRSFNANRNDVALQGQFFHGQVGLRGVAGQNVREFSAMDYEGGPGYLATPNGVIHQRGQGTTRTVSGP